MGVLGSMVRKDLLRRLRAPLALVVLLAFPVVFSLLLAVSFGGGGSPARVQLIVENLDEGFLSELLVNALRDERMAEHVDVQSVGQEGLERIHAGKASALLRIPVGFTTNLLEGQPITLELIRNPAQGIYPEIAEQIATVITDLLSSASFVLREPLDRLSTMTEGDTKASATSVALLATQVYEVLDRASGLLLPPAITLETIQLGGEEGDPDSATGSGMPNWIAIFLLVLPGISVWALFMIGDLGMRDILEESQRGTLRRQICGPLTPTRLVIGKACATATLALLGLVVLSVLGGIASGGAIDFPAFVVLSLALIVAVTGFASVISGLAASQRQGGTLGSVLMLIFGFTGGSFIPLNGLPPFMRQLAPFSPFYWGTKGYADLISESAGIAEILPNAVVLIVLGGLSLAIGSLLLTRRVARGGLA